MNTATCIFSALDTWFFRESRPHGTVGGAELGSLFPPPPRTVLGALRTLVGEQYGIDWNALDKADKTILRLIGADDSQGDMSLSSVHLLWNEELIFPAPMHLMQHGKAFCYLTIGDAVQCDLGRVRLPQLPKLETLPDARATSLDNVWLTPKALEAVLKGEQPSIEALKRHHDIFEEEPRLGIARNNEKRVVEESLLYQTKHVRPKAELSVAAIASGLPNDFSPQTGLVRFGGEGRLAQVRFKSGDIALPKAPTEWAKDDGIILILLSPALLNDSGKSWVLFPTFNKTEENGCTVWKGELEGISLTLHSAILGKSRREGGWDMKKREPRSRKSLIPAGSCWYVTVDSGDIKTAVNALHGKQIGAEKELGRGRIVCGRWKRSEIQS